MEILKNPYRLKPIEFKFNEYLNKGFELMKNDFGNLFLAYIFMMIMSIIPFCSFLAIGNFYKYCQRKTQGKNPSPTEVFNFDDFMPYLIPQLIILGVIILMYFPFLVLIPFLPKEGSGDAPSPIIVGFLVVYLLVFFVTTIYFSLKAFYMPGLISLRGIKDYMEAWKMSKVMTQGNLIIILLFSIVVSFLSQLGILLCVVGLIFTMPMLYTFHYFAYEDAIQQIDEDEIQQIGTPNS